MAIARLLVIGGVILIVLGGIVYLVTRLGVPLGKLPGDIVIKRDNFTFSFPLATSIVVSVVLTLLINLFLRYWRK